MGWELTAEVTADQVFEWAQEEWDRQDWFPLPKMRRVYLGLIRIVPGTICDIEAIEDAVFARGYRVRFWRGVASGVPDREVIEVEKADAAERAQWGKQAPDRNPGTHICSRMRGTKKEEQ
jgi:hypothetical protein